ncbi:RNA polymerase sigma factor [Paraburkholderia agricolaris]|uniref:RNA polymerase sigma factor n=1 Tax=Paraburkholderia agricolaris TaxID=2152888 RepID=UPI001FE25015|nr:RNA polymerase sigma factor [Paraburkholderia agricolaris]
MVSESARKASERASRQAGINKEPRHAERECREKLFRDLVEKHGARLYRFVLRRTGSVYIAEEITQQTFVEAACGFDSYRGDARLSTWLYGIAVNLIRNHLNRCPERRFMFESCENEEATLDVGASVEQVVAGRQAFRVLLAQIDALPQEMREVVLLVGVREMSYEEVSAMLRIPIGTVRSRLSRARAALRDSFGAMD